MKITLGLFLCTLLLATSAQADSVLVFDLTPSKSGETANRVYSLPDAPDDLMRLLRQFSTTGGTETEETTLFSDLHSALDDADLRWITARGDEVQVFALYDKSLQNKPTIHFKETQRKTRLAEDLTTLAKIIEKLPATFAEVKGLSNVRAFNMQYKLIFTRAQLAVDAAADPRKDTADEKQIPATATLITGPVEHVFLSSDVPVNRIRDVKYDATGHALGSQDTPSTFYLGLNFLIGDIFSDQRSIVDNVVIKPLLKISKQPLDSYGIAIGYRVPPVKKFGFELDAFSPFAGYIWTRQAGPTTNITNRHARVGISFNLDKALGWMK